MFASQTHVVQSRAFGSAECIEPRASNLGTELGRRNSQLLPSGANVSAIWVIPRCYKDTTGCWVLAAREDVWERWNSRGDKDAV